VITAAVERDIFGHVMVGLRLENCIGKATARRIRKRSSEADFDSVVVERHARLTRGGIIIKVNAKVVA
jgi:hypothetical protein